MKYNKVMWCGIEGMFGSWAIPLPRLTKQGSLFGTKRETHFAWQPHPAGQGNPCPCRRAKSALLHKQGCATHHMLSRSGGAQPELEIPKQQN